MARESVDFIRLLEASLSSEKLALLRSAGGIARDEGAPMYLVGGAVRDLLLGRPVEDLDLVVVGDAEMMASIVAKRLSGQVVSRSQFSTARVKVDGVSLDLVTARSERYSRPGALPQIAHGTIEEDLARRDFSINAMAVPLHLEAKSGLLDPFNGAEDLRRGLVRVLHDGSFADDATRIMRAIRYEQRLGFRLEERTESLLIDNLPMLDTISGDRLLREVQRWLSEERAPDILLRADELGVMAAVHSPLSRSGESVRSAVERSKGRVEAPVWLGVLAYALTTPEGEGLIARLRLPTRWARVARDTIALREGLPLLSDEDIPPARLYDALAHLEPAAVQACALTAAQETSRANLTLFLEKLRGLKPKLGGRDLIEMGVPQGPAVGEMLKLLNRARLEGKLSGREEEEALVRRVLLEEGPPSR